MRRRPAIGAALLAVALSAGCGARPAAPYREGPIDFGYAVDGESRALSRLRGRPLVLVLVRTSELTSDLYLDQVAAAQPRAFGNTRLLVLSIAPNEAPLLPAYLEERGLPFPIGLAEWAVAEGTSALGLVPVVPTTYLLDEDGAVAGMIPGAVTAASLEGELARHGWD